MSFLQKTQQILEIETPLTNFDPTTKLVDLGADSVKLVAVGALVEETYNRPVYKDDLMILSVGFLVNLGNTGDTVLVNNHW